ncbi:MAG TPA: hypothetical protein VFY64_09520 [Nitrososphaeraceae archaeon]|nr:hypothetical protein [Nitrososphaeraceae archaeon]
MKTKRWNCPNCEMSSSRHWNVKRHIQRRHRTMGEPLSYDTMQYYKDMTPQNLRFPLVYSHHTPLFFPTPKEKPHKNFSDLLEHQFLEPIRKVVELKNLLSQLSTIQPQQRIMSAGGVYPHTPSMTFDSGESNNYLSEESSLDKESDSEIVGYRGHVCGKCSTIGIDTIFRHKDRESGQVETTHTCNSKRLANTQVEPNKDKTINDLYEKLPEVIKKKVNSWTENSAYLVAIEMPPMVALKNSFEITPNNENHWAARAIKDKQTILNDEELSDFLCKVGNATYASFKVILPSSQEEQQQESSTCRYLMIITDNKVNLSFEQLLQYIADLSR